MSTCYYITVPDRTENLFHFICPSSESGRHIFIGVASLLFTMLYESQAWKHKRALILRRDGYRCQECKRYGRSRQADTVHHIYPLELYPDRGLLSWNLISLCSSCHNAMHDRDTHALTEKGKKLQQRIERARGYPPAAR